MMTALLRIDELELAIGQPLDGSLVDDPSRLTVFKVVQGGSCHTGHFMDTGQVKATAPIPRDDVLCFLQSLPVRLLVTT
jgi:hypothetical protein